MQFLFKRCTKCMGDLIQEDDEWRCLQCGRVYYPECSPMEMRLPVADREDREFTLEVGVHRERRKVRRSARHLNFGVECTRDNEEKWFDKNRQVIDHLDRGKKVREIAEIVGQGPRQIRVVRERLRDLRSTEPELVPAG